MLEYTPNDVYKLFTQLAQASKPLPKMNDNQKMLWFELRPYFEYNPFITNCPTEIQHAMKIDAMTWTTSDGEVLRPSQMGTRHIFYCMRLLVSRMFEHELNSAIDVIRVADKLFPVGANWLDYCDDPYSDFEEDVLNHLQMYHGYHALYWEVDRRLKLSNIV